MTKTQASKRACNGQNINFDLKKLDPLTSITRKTTQNATHIVNI